tara:strand:+ start:2996 stop:4027 length:1032 start_codon:yes stop_codon:yes gene_type:complete
LSILILISGCAGDFSQIDGDAETEQTSEQKITAQISSLSSFRVNLTSTDIFSVNNPNAYGCAGDVKRYKYPLEDTYFPEDSNSTDGSTLKPSFVKNVSVDITNSNMDSSNNSASDCSFGNDSAVPPPAFCASFDTYSPLFEADGLTAWSYWPDSNGTLPLLTPGNTARLQNYLLLDYFCVEQGPVNLPDPEVNKLLAGGIDIDLDRSAIDSTEDILISVLLYPFSTENLRPVVDEDTEDLTGATDYVFSNRQSARFDVHLFKTGMTEANLKSKAQPRYLFFSNETAYPKHIKRLATLAPPGGSPQERQVYIPLSKFPTADRIRIERYSGSGLIASVSVFRMKN